ncbi:MAG TPA: polysaccharide pyruvyl transferase family protein, partial [Thermoanaerobaculia bacterium]|nr:polysaccharide pyruvyl transferase family protein [Thermoanaerobaculia bacterium]
MRILIAGSYGMGNTGDEAILAGILGPLRARLPEALLRVVSGNPEATRALHGVEALPWDDWAAISGAVAGSDLLILGGGGIFFDYTGFDPGRLLEQGAPDLAHYGSFPLLAWLLDKPLAIYAAGVGPLSTPEGREMVRLAFTSASRATVRDAESRDLLAEIGADASRVEVTADPAFALAVADPGGLEETGRPRIALTSRPWQLAGPQEEWEKSFAGSIASFALARNAQILLLPFHAGSDEESLLRIRDGLEAGGLEAGDVVLFRGSLPPSEVAGLLGRCDLTVGLRLHSILLSMLAGTPAVALSYDPKVRSLARLAGHEELCLDLPGLSGLGPLLEDAWARREEIRRDFLRVSGELKILAEANADRILEIRARPELDGASEAAFRRLAARAFGERLREINERGATIERQWTQLDQSRIWLESQQRAAELLKKELEAVRAERDTARTSVQRLREQRDLLLGERNDLARRLGEFEATLAYGMVSRFWGVMRQTFPEGSRRRGLYRGVKKVLGKVIRTQSSPSMGALELPPDSDGHDPRGDLVRFEDRVRESGADTVVAFFSATQLIESEGQRPTQLALELARRGIPVVFCYWRWWQ